MKASWWAKLLGVNAAILILLYLVVGEQSSRVAYAAQEGSSFLISRYLLTLVTTLANRGGQFSSPLTLDWVQLLVVVLVALNLWYVYQVVASRSTKTAARDQSLHSLGHRGIDCSALEGHHLVPRLRGI